jgi:hypothetical protein
MLEPASGHDAEDADKLLADFLKRRAVVFAEEAELWENLRRHARDVMGLAIPPGLSRRGVIEAIGRRQARFLRARLRPGEDRLGLLENDERCREIFRGCWDSDAEP